MAPEVQLQTLKNLRFIVDTQHVGKISHDLFDSIACDKTTGIWPWNRTRLSDFDVLQGSTGCH